MKPRKPSIASPTDMSPLYTIETNALGYCKCAILELDQDEAFVAVPSTLDDNLADIFSLSSGKRIHRSVGKDAFQSKTGTIMSLALIANEDKLLIVIAYESGKLAVFEHADVHPRQSGDWTHENEGWRKMLESQAHKEPSKSSETVPRSMQVNTHYLLS